MFQFSAAVQRIIGVVKNVTKGWVEDPTNRHVDIKIHGIAVSADEVNQALAILKDGMHTEYRVLQLSSFGVPYLGDKVKPTGQLMHVGFDQEVMQKKRCDA